MEPGLRDREYVITPVMTQLQNTAAMEPGLRDREYYDAQSEYASRGLAAMEPGLRDREYPGRPVAARIR